MEAIVDHLIQKLRVLNRDALYNLPVPFLAIPGIPFRVDGLECPL